YTALSYTWGHPKKTHVLRISGAPFAITASLAEALGALPRIASSEYLWLDQVCIDQADDKEKNHQVQIMGEIYSNSHKVIIWTGGEIQGLQLAVDTYISPGRQICERGYYLGALAKSLDVYAEPLRQLLLRPWFRRAWVIQEAVLAK
ncbi:heterokaryon incompatibility, partial [Schizothecium vesticola]